MSVIAMEEIQAAKAKATNLEVVLRFNRSSF
jgi:hypothetical protein